MGDAAPREGNIGGEVQTMVSRCLDGKELFCFVFPLNVLATER